MNKPKRILESHIYPVSDKDETPAFLGKEFFWTGTEVKMFPTLIKMRSFIIFAVLAQFAKEESELLNFFYHIPTEKLEEHENGISLFLKKFSKSSEEEKEQENQINAPFYQGIGNGLFQHAKKKKTQKELKAIYYKTLLLEGTACYVEKESEEGRLKAQICLYELLMLTKSVTFSSGSHPYLNRHKSFQKDYLLLLSTFACREKSISSFQILYLEKIAREFQLSGAEFSKSIQLSLRLDSQERKEQVKTIIKNHNFPEEGGGEIPLTDCMLLERLRLTRELKEDKLQIEKLLCKNKYSRKELEEKIEILLKELTL
ncbi:MAG: hypothetical protein R3Y63_07575 [Eubacteriales bacterium]